MKQPGLISLLTVALALTSVSSVTRAAEIRVGVASNFASTLAVLAERFEQQSGHRILLSSGSTGKLYAQIKHGAPFDLFFAADLERPQRLEKEGDGVPGTRFTYAIGRIALWSRDPDLVDETGSALNTGSFRKLAIANPATAPYGLAAKQTLERLGVWQALQPKLVSGENIAQTYQFVASGNADLGFVALPQLLSKKSANGSMWEVPTTYYRPIEQQALLLRKSRQPAAAKAFLAYIRGEGTREILSRFGYAVPVNR